MNLISNVKQYFAKTNIEYKIVIAEQNDDNKFNRGYLLNIGFIESEKLFNENREHKYKYIHMNTDYTFNLNRSFPVEILDFNKGFLDLHRPPHPVLGAACVFDAESYKEINGFPNDLYGWGGDDWAIYKRIINKNIPLETPNTLFNTGFIIEKQHQFENDCSNNFHNCTLAARDDLETNGVSQCKYTVNSNGEFTDNEKIFHLLFNFL